jgi:hypothetical protein
METPRSPFRKFGGRSIRQRERVRRSPSPGTRSAIEELKERIWRKVIDKGQLAEVEREHRVISTKLLAGKTVVRIYGKENPGNGFEIVEPDLEDVYFTTMAGHAEEVPVLEVAR